MSPLLANIYLNPLDHALTDAGYAMCVTQMTS